MAVNELPALPRNRPGARGVSVAAALFVLMVLFSAVRFYLLRHFVDFTDEDDHTTIGWLLTRGKTLYGSVFSHHMPLPYLLAHAVAVISPTDHPAHFRAVPWLSYLLVALALVGSPLCRRHPGAGLLAAAAFLVLISIAIPPFLGHMLLAEVPAGCGLAIALAMVVLPTLSGLEPRPVDALAGGAALGLAFTASPTVILPAAAAAIGIGGTAAFAPRSGPSLTRLAIPAILGATASLAVVATWLTRFGSFGGFLEDVIHFNKNVYAPVALGANGPSLGGVFRGAAEGWLDLLSSIAPPTVPHRPIVLAFLALAVGAIGAVAALARGRAAGHSPRQARTRGLIAAASMMAVFFLSAPRGFGFRGLPFFIIVLAVGSLAGAVVLARAPSILKAAFLLIVLVPLVASAVQDETVRTVVATPTTWPSGLLQAENLIRDHTTPDERIAVFPASPRVYLETGRLPATDSVYFLPWQATWEESRPFEKSTCAQLQRARPRYIVMMPAKIWDLFQWEGYALCIDRYVKENYRRLPDQRFEGLLWERISSETVP